MSVIAGSRDRARRARLSAGARSPRRSSHYVLGEDPDPRTAGLLRRFHANSGVRTRSLALPLEAYRELDGFTGANAAWRDVAVDLGAQCVDECP